MVITSLPASFPPSLEEDDRIGLIVVIHVGVILPNEFHQRVSSRIWLSEI